VNTVLEGNKAYGDWRSDAPGVRRHIDVSDLPDPYASRSTAHSPEIVVGSTDARLRVPVGLVKLFASGLAQPRLMRVAPNGDVFVAESNAGRIRVLRPSEDGDHVTRNEIYASGLRLPFGIAFYPNGNDPEWVYVANTDSVVRFPYRGGDLHSNGKAEIIVPSLPAGSGHWTRDIAFSQDNTKMFISVGSASNASETTGHFDIASPRQWVPLLRGWVKKIVVGSSSEDETERADVLVFDPRGRDRRVYASGIRNCVGMAIDPITGELWCSTNERDGLGDNLPPTTSRVSVKTASTAGLGTISGLTKTHVTKVSIPSFKTRSSFLMYSFNHTPRQCR
jgi:glucose/arabinose dehydrogenase